MEVNGKSSNDAKTDEEPRLLLGPNLSQSRTNLPLLFLKREREKKDRSPDKSRDK